MGDRAFEQQFQWEVDRWVFRNRHRGDPTEVTSAERDRLLALHRSRMTRGSRMFGAMVVGTLVLCWPSHLYVVPMVYVAAVLLGMPMLTRWAYQGVVDEMRGKPLLGMPLGLTGRMARTANGAGMRSLAVSLLWLVGFAGLFVAAFEKGDYSGPRWMVLTSYAMLAVTFLFVSGLLVLRWGQSQRKRVKQVNAVDLSRARKMYVSRDFD